MNKYVLENSCEFDRLETQSRVAAYDFVKELSFFKPKETGNILDAGCGSGIVSRHLAERYPHSKILGCDFSDDRVRTAIEKGAQIPNLRFQTENLLRLSFDNNHFDGIVCRYVLEHFNENDRTKVLLELFRSTKPNGILNAIDVDGLLYNLFPQTDLVSGVLAKLSLERPIDTFVGRKLPRLVQLAGFTNIHYKIETHTFQGETLKVEFNQLKSRFSQLMPFLKTFIGAEKIAETFVAEYLNCLKLPGAVLFYNMFSVVGTKPNLKKEV